MTFLYKYDVKKAQKVNNVVRNVVVNNHLVIKNGTVVIWNFYVCFVPCFFILRFVSQLSDSYNAFFKDLGYVQGKCAIDIQRQMFGVLSPDIFEKVTKQTDLVGYGPFSFELSDASVQFKISDNISTYFIHYFELQEIQKLFNYLYYNIKGVYDYGYDVLTDLSVVDFSCTLKHTPNKIAELTDKQKEIEKFLNSKALILKKA